MNAQCSTAQNFRQPRKGHVPCAPSNKTSCRHIQAASRACLPMALSPHSVREMSSHRKEGQAANQLQEDRQQGTKPEKSSQPSIVHKSGATLAMGAAIAVLGMSLLLSPPAAAIYGSASSDDNFENIPGTLSSSTQGEDGSKQLSKVLGGKNGKQVQGCTRTCLPTCVRGGSNGGAPGLGPLSMRRDIIVFKDGFRSRSYCLTECANACSRLAEAKERGIP
ncbi:hypothetical protein DUNSADRAFT_674 [Dunaliella salina]|uniref:Encoded protein n=1 Tax=Dunaliella salina TaxID=3046 RepID=A0ABQ7GY19_DUNSA|nr:hypothetical protein DUNSADRAFT_674 [Dunaliella salina]|eukprot:KAF5839500.1 hypothetical protein DUNSADRAFT_674 [Dunaliella salina]